MEIMGICDADVGSVWVESVAEVGTELSAGVRVVLIDFSMVAGLVFSPRDDTGAEGCRTEDCSSACGIAAGTGAGISLVGLFFEAVMGGIETEILGAADGNSDTPEEDCAAGVWLPETDASLLSPVAGTENVNEVRLAPAEASAGTLLDAFEAVVNTPVVALPFARPEGGALPLDGSTFPDATLLFGAGCIVAGSAAGTCSRDFDEPENCPEPPGARPGEGTDGGTSAFRREAFARTVEIRGGEFPMMATCSEVPDPSQEGDAGNAAAAVSLLALEETEENASFREVAVRAAPVEDSIELFGIGRTDKFSVEGKFVDVG